MQWNQTDGCRDFADTLTQGFLSGEIVLLETHVKKAHFTDKTLLMNIEDNAE